MPQKSTESNSRLSLRLPPKDKALIMRAVALRQTNLTDFVVHTALDAAREVIEAAERIELSERDSFRVLELLESPPAPNEKLMAAARALNKNS